MNLSLKGAWTLCLGAAWIALGASLIPEPHDDTKART